MQKRNEAAEIGEIEKKEEEKIGRKLRRSIKTQTLRNYYRGTRPKNKLLMMRKVTADSEKTDKRRW